MHRRNRNLLKGMSKLVFSNISGYIIVLFISFIANIFFYIYPLVYSKIIDDGVTNKSTDNLIKYGLIYVFVFFLHIAIEYIGFRLSIVFENSIFRKLQMMAFEEIALRKAFSEEGSTQGETSAFSLNDIPVYMSFVITIFLSMPLIISTLIFSAIVMLLINWLLALIIILLQLGIIFIRSLSNKSIEKAALEKRENYGSLVLVTLEAIKAGSILNMIGAKKYLHRKYSQATDSFIAKSMITSVKCQKIQSISEFSVETVTIFQLLVMGVFVISGQFTIGLLFSFMQYAKMFSHPISSLSSLFVEIASSTKELEKCTAMISRQSAPAKYEKAMSVSEGEIVIKNLSHSYNDQEIFKDTSAYFHKGSVNLLMGDSGSGKSTLLAMLSGDIAPSKSTVYIDSYDLADYSQSQICSQVSLVPQSPILFSDSFWNNLTLGIDYPTIRVDNICKDCQIDSLIADKGGYDALIEEAGQNLSQGEKQRICLARALLQNKPILLLDEVTSGLDEQNAKKIENIIETVSKTKTVICVSHIIRVTENNHIKYMIVDKKLSRENRS